MRVKVADFGTAIIKNLVFIDGQASVPALVHASGGQRPIESVGTTLWMSPEVIEGALCFLTFTWSALYSSCAVLAHSSPL